MPIFGNQASAGSALSIENKIVGSYFKMGAKNGYGTSIATYMNVDTTQHTLRCALYDSSNNLVTNSMTDKRTIQKSSTYHWEFFIFGSVKPFFLADNWYYIVIWSNSTTGDATVGYSNIVGDNIYQQPKTFGAGEFPSVYVPNPINTLPNKTLSIYCSYDEYTHFCGFWPTQWKYKIEAYRRGLEK